MTESEVRKLLRQMKELDSQTAFRDFYNMTYDRLFRIAYYYVKQEEWSQEIVLDIFLKLWKQRDTLLDVKTSRTIVLFWSRTLLSIIWKKNQSTPPFIPILCRNHRNKAILRKSH